MKPQSIPLPTREPVELLLLRALRSGVTRTLLSSVGSVATVACGDDVSTPATDAGRAPVIADEAALRDAGSEAGGASSMDASVNTRDAQARDAQAGADAGSAADARVVAVDAQTFDAASSDAAALQRDSAAEQRDSAADAATDWPVGTGLVCPAGALVPVTAARLAPSTPKDYLAVREVQGFREPSTSTSTDWTGTAFKVLSETGERCETATSADCAQQVARHPAAFVATSCLMTCRELSIVTTSGNEVKRWATHDELVTLLSPIDTVDEAVMMVAGAGYDLACDTPDRSSAREVADGYELTATRITTSCAPVTTMQYRVHVSRVGELRVLGERVFALSNACIGRIPEGLTSMHAVPRHESLGDQLARCAHLEDASVYAFERLARELSLHHAPRELVAAALHAADDEVRHARVTAALARTCGGAPVTAQVEELPVRTLEQVARENAVEGCVRETYGALVGAYQAEHAQDVRVRALMREIAPDEARHAALSARVHAWALTQLDEAARGRVYSAQREAIESLRQSCAELPWGEVERALGLPPATVAQALVSELSRSLWNEALSRVA